MSEALPLVFCFDANYADYAAVAAYSAHAHARSPQKFYWLCTAPALPRAAALQRHLDDRGVKVELIEADDSRFSGWLEAHHLTRAAYLRLLIPEYLKEPRAIYLDCDTVILGDLAELYRTDMGDAVIGGVPDLPDSTGKRGIALAQGDTYINSGVLLMDLERLRADDLPGQAERIYAKHREEIMWLDQCILNKYAEGRKRLLDRRWNYLVLPNWMKVDVLTGALARGEASVVHYIGRIKPWHKWCNPRMAEVWMRHAKALAWPQLKLHEIGLIDQALSLADSLDLNGQFEESSRLKGMIIASLRDQFTALRRTTNQA